MAEVVFNVAKGALVEKFRDGEANGLVLLLEAVESDAALADHDNLQSMLAAAGNTEFAGVGYARKTGITGTIVIDNVNDRIEISFPDQTWQNLSGNPIVAVIIAYQESASDSGRIPLTKHDYSMIPDGGDIRVRMP